MSYVLETNHIIVKYGQGVEELFMKLLSKPSHLKDMVVPNNHR